MTSVLLVAILNCSFKSVSDSNLITLSIKFPVLSLFSLFCSKLDLFLGIKGDFSLGLEGFGLASLENCAASMLICVGWVFYNIEYF